MSTGSDAIDGKFVIEEVISKSPQSEFYRARDLETDQPVTLKVVRPSSSADANELLTRSLQEFKVLRKLDHPNAIRVISTALTPDNLFYIAMEELTGRTLSQLIHQEGALSCERVANYLDQLAGVIDAAHQLGIVHRDIKPDNIRIVTDEVGNEVVKLDGFIFAKIQAEAGGKHVNVTQAGVAIGTPAYMSPEQAMGKKVTKFADIYSLGITLFTALTGRVPFEGKTDLNTMLSHVKSPIPKFSERNPNVYVPEGIEGAVRWAMSKEFAERPKSVSELARYFREAIAHPDDVPEEVSAIIEKQSKSSLAPMVDRPMSATPEAAAEETPDSFLLKAVVFALLAIVIGAAAALIGR